MRTNDTLNIRESAALLHPIFPGYPYLRRKKLTCPVCSINPNVSSRLMFNGDEPRAALLTGMAEPSVF
jgi:hypothetical protein